MNEPLDEELKNNFIGGRGIGSKILYDETSPSTDPLGSENRLIISTGPVTGTIVPTSARFTITSKSPLTGILGDGNAGGFFGSELKLAGYDAIIVQGKSDTPVYLFIYDDIVQIRDAQGLWGKNTHETERALKSEIGDHSFHILSIGQAGENLVEIAGIINDEEHAAARCGLGAVMGSKNLKAIAVRGTKSINIAHPDELLHLVDLMYVDYKKSPAFEWYTHYGGTVAIIDMCKAGSAPVRNYLKSGGTDLEQRKPLELRQVDVH
jgi:aldehyde:ferredoxin oxidoreductase